MRNPIIKYVLILLILVAGVATDQLSKQWASANMKQKTTQVFVKNLIDLGYTENHGMVFGINNRRDNNSIKNFLLIIRIILSVGLTVFIIFHHKNSLLFHTPLLLILSGAIGNVIDSLKFGHVIDFIHLHLGKLLDWPFLFNLADAWVCIGMGILLVQSFFNEKKKSEKPVSAATTNEIQSPAIPHSDAQ